MEDIYENTDVGTCVAGRGLPPHASVRLVVYTYIYTYLGIYKRGKRTRLRADRSFYLTNDDRHTIQDRKKKSRIKKRGMGPKQKSHKSFIVLVSVVVASFCVVPKKNMAASIQASSDLVYTNLG